MKVYKVHPPGFNACIFTDLETAVEEIKVLLDGGENVNVEVLEMTQQQVDNLPEHQGY